MSSAIRTMEKRILKRRGFCRQTERLEHLNCVPRVVRYAKGTGPILNPDGDPIGRHYPVMMRASAGFSNPFTVAARKKSFVAAMRDGASVIGNLSTLRAMAMRVARRAA